MTSELSASIVRLAESTFGSPRRSVEWTICRWRFESSTTSGSITPSVQAGGGEGRATLASRAAGPDQQNARLEQPLLALLADLGDEQVACVAGPLRRREEVGVVSS